MFMAISLVDTLSTGLLLWRSLPRQPARPTFRRDRSPVYGGLQRA